MAWSGRRSALAVTLLFFSLALQSSFPVTLADDPATLKCLTLTVYLDGYVQVVHELEVDPSYPSVNVTLLGEAQSFMVVDEQGLLLDFSLVNASAIVDALGCSWMKASYFTQDLTSKTGKYWTLRANVSINATVVLPDGASIISLNVVPDLIESSGDQVTLVMPAGLIEISFIATRSVFEEPSDDSFLLLAGALSFLILVGVSVIWVLKRRKSLKPKEIKASRVDIDKLLEREKHLRAEEVQAIRVLAEKNGSAFEAELFERLALPRTTTWRLLKRLQAMEIVEIRKTRRQNLVSIRKKYMKKQVKGSA